LARVLGKCGNANVFKGARPKRGSPPAFFLIWRDFKKCGLLSAPLSPFDKGLGVSFLVFSFTDIIYLL